MLITNTSAIVQQELMSRCNCIKIFANKKNRFFERGGVGSGSGWGQEVNVSFSEINCKLFITLYFPQVVNYIRLYRHITIFLSKIFMYLLFTKTYDDYVRLPFWLNFLKFADSHVFVVFFCFVLFFFVVVFFFFFFFFFFFWRYCSDTFYFKYILARRLPIY